MNLQRHQRIAQIKRLSGYLLTTLTCIQFLLWGCWILMVIMAFMPTTTFKFNPGGISIGGTEFDFLLRIVSVLVVSILMFFALKVVHHFRALMQHFCNGEIFNKNAIAHARNALFNGLVVFGVYILFEILGWGYLAVSAHSIGVSLPGWCVGGCVFFGLMYVLLWALEIGHDLNEESELTI